MAAKEKLKAGAVIIETPSAVCLNTEDLASSRFAHVFEKVKGLDERAKVFFCVAHVDESCHTCGRVMSHMWMSHVTHVDESCHTCGRVMSHV